MEHRHNQPVTASEEDLPPIPAKRYFTIGEVSELCGVKPHVLRYWEQEFTQLKPVKRRGNRRFYQHHEVLLVRRIRELLYSQCFTISGARNRLEEELLQAAEGTPGKTLSIRQIRDELNAILRLLGKPPDSATLAPPAAVPPPSSPSPAAFSAPVTPELFPVAEEGAIED
jgi:DNA-binding transcriptional MerR regulator